MVNKYFTVTRDEYLALKKDHEETIHNLESRWFDTHSITEIFAMQAKERELRNKLVYAKIV